MRIFTELLRGVILVVAFAGLGLAAWGQEGVFNIRSYGAKGDGHTLDTKAIDKAVAACVKAGGGVVLVPAGTFVIGTVRLYSNVELRLGPGSVLLASANTNDYGLQRDYGFSGSGAGGLKLGLIFADRAENVSLTGTGVIDGRSEAYMYKDSVQVSGEEDSKYTRQGMGYMNAREGRAEAPLMWKGQWIDRPGTQILFHNCKRVLVRDITVRNANDWTMDLNACDDAKVLGISIDNNMSVPNSDGVDMYDSRHVIIADCDIRAGDDAIAVVGTSDVKVTNCSLHSRSCGIRVGYNAFNDNNSGNLLFDNIRIYGSNRGVGIFQRRGGAISNALFSNMIIDTRLYPGQWWGHGELTISRGPLTDIFGGNFDLRPVNDASFGIFKHDIPAVFARHVEGLTLRGFEVRWGSGLPAFFTRAVYCEDFSGLTIDGFRGGGGPMAANPGAVIELRDGAGAVLGDVHGAGVVKTEVDGLRGDGVGLGGGGGN